MTIREVWDGSAWADHTHWLPEVWDGSKWNARAESESDLEEWDGSAWVVRWFSPPLDVSGLAGVVAGTTATLTWTNVSGRSPGIVVERRTLGATWSELATLPAGSTTYSDTAVGIFQYRVVPQRTINGVTKRSSGPPITGFLTLASGQPRHHAAGDTVRVAASEIAPRLVHAGGDTVRVSAGEIAPRGEHETGDTVRVSSSEIAPRRAHGAGDTVRVSAGEVVPRREHETGDVIRVSAGEVSPRGHHGAGDTVRVSAGEVDAITVDRLATPQNVTTTQR